ncbi:hypothetical protein [Sodalis endosymbiont of Henestaris halophilus]|uniref:hypothetical protein n=1 Tax=Sodalis endosymbiont of Henestaris halophilus TaxID=1929246 RepID=UPI0012FDD0B3|nr:hypothetical protein [Sodalis endosymbiont of Henestaris halophilus]
MNFTGMIPIICLITPLLVSVKMVILFTKLKNVSKMNSDYLVLIDVNCEYHGCAGNITRIFSVKWPIVFDATYDLE